MGTMGDARNAAQLMRVYWMTRSRCVARDVAARGALGSGHGIKADTQGERSIAVPVILVAYMQTI